MLKYDNPHMLSQMELTDLIEELHFVKRECRASKTILLFVATLMV